MTIRGNSLYIFLGTLFVLGLVSMGAIWWAASQSLPEERVAVMTRLASDRVMLDGRWHDLSPEVDAYSAVQEDATTVGDADYWRAPPLGQGWAWKPTTLGELAASHWGKAVIVRLGDLGDGRVVTDIYGPAATAKAATPGD